MTNGDDPIWRVELRRVEDVLEIRLNQLEARLRALERPAPSRYDKLSEAIDRQLAMMNADRMKPEPEPIRDMLARIETMIRQLLEDTRREH